ncbi:MAG: helix-turn-helix transcriptional regulator [Mycobacteriales bacterium]
MPDPQVQARSGRRIRKICEAAIDARALRLAILEELAKVVGFDAYAWPLTDPQTEIGSAPLADVPCLPELPQLIRLKYLTPVNRWTTMLSSPVATLREATGGDLSLSLLWRDLLSRYDIGDVASMVFRDRFGCWSFLDLWRTGVSARFTGPEVEFLAAISEPVTTALRRCQADTFIARPPRDEPHAGPVVLLLSGELQVRAQTPDTEDYLRMIVPPPQDRAPIPASAYNVAAQLLATEAGIDSHPAATRLHLSDGLWITLRAARIGNADDADIAVTIEETTPAQRVPVFARAFALTTRETELLDHLSTGVATTDVAARMFLSQHTVQDHLKSIFAKTSTHSRSTLLSRALGT